MVNWSSVGELTKDADAFRSLIFALFGLYSWEFLSTLRFEWLLLTGVRKFQWPLVIFYFLTRYCLAIALVGIVVALSATTQINCQALYGFNQWAGNTAIASASTCLMLRTIAVWNKKLTVVIPLVVLSLGHWALLYHGVANVSAQWSPQAGACVVVNSEPIFLNIIFFYTMGFDFVVFCTTAFGLLSKGTRSSLWRLLFNDGIIYFVITFCANSVPAVLNVLDLNPVMNIIAAVPAVVISTIAVCRCVRRLHEFYNEPVYVHSSHTRMQASHLPGTATQHLPRRFSQAGAGAGGVQIKVDTFTIQENEDPHSEDSPSLDGKKIHDDIEMGRMAY